MAGEGIAAFDPVASLLGDLDTITSLAQSGAQAGAQQPALIPGETRPAALLLVDIVGFTPLAQQLGAEAVSRLTDRCFRIFQLSVEAHGGYCDKLIGDAGLYVFPGHVSYEPPCQGALRSALEIQRRVAQVNQSLAGGADTFIRQSDAPENNRRQSQTGVSAPPQLSLRCGVSFGEVTRQRIGGDAQQFTVMGDAVNLAQRLEASAPPGGVCTAREVVDAVGGLFEFESAGERELKGMGTRELFIVTGERPRDVRLRGRGEISPLVGRDELLAEAVAQVRVWLEAGGADTPVCHGQASKDADKSVCATASGTGRLLVLRGATAVGKSRLAWEVTQRLQAELPLATATAHCTPHGGLLGFAAELCKVAGLTAENVAERWAELVGARRASPETRPQAQDSHASQDQTDAGEARVAPTEDYLQHLPLLAYVLGSSTVDTSAIRQGDGAAFSAACQAALAACLTLAAREGKLPLLVVEDVQWLGDLAAVLAHLLNNVELPVPLAVVATARTAADDELLAGLVGGEAQRLRILEIAALTPEQGRLLLAELLPGAELPAALEAELHEKSLGLPYYYEEAARLLLRRGVVAEDVGATRASPEHQPDSSSAGDARFAPTAYKVVGTLDALPIPDDLRSLILGRLDALPAELRELAQHASVLGRSFTLDNLLALEARLGAYGCADVCAALGTLHGERILHPDLDGPTDETIDQRPATSDSPRYFFTHVLTQEAAYASLLSVNRRRLHGAAGEILAAEHVPGTAAEWDLLPALYEHYAAAGRHADACRVACETLMLRARSHRLDLCGQWREAAQQMLALAGGSRELQARVSWARGVEALIRQDYQPARAQLESALLDSQDCADSALRVGVTIDLALVLRELRDFALAEGLLLEAREIADRLEETHLREEVLDSLGAVYRKQGRVKESTTVLEEALVTLRASSNFSRLCRTLIRLANDYMDLNQLEQALALFEEAEGVVKRQSNRTLEVMLISNKGMCYGLLGQSARAIATLEEGLAKSEAIGWKEGEAHNCMNIGHMHLEHGSVEIAEPFLLKAAMLFRKLGDQSVLGITLATLADVQIQLKRMVEARDTLREAERCFEPTGNQFCRALLQCHWAHFHFASNEYKEAVFALSRAKALSRHTTEGSESVLNKKIAELEERVSAVSFTG